MILNLKSLIIIVVAGILPCGCGQPSTEQSQNTQTPAAQTSPAPSTTAHAYPQGSIKKANMAICVVCAVNEGSTENEAAHEVIDYEGKTYSFCNEEEKAQFISTPAKFASK